MFGTRAILKLPAWYRYKTRIARILFIACGIFAVFICYYLKFAHVNCHGLRPQRGMKKG